MYKISRHIIFLIILSLIVYNYGNIKKHSSEPLECVAHQIKWQMVTVQITYTLHNNATTLRLHYSRAHSPVHAPGLFAQDIERAAGKCLHPCWLHGINKCILKLSALFVVRTTHVATISIDRKKWKKKTTTLNGQQSVATNSHKNMIDASLSMSCSWLNLFRAPRQSVIIHLWALINWPFIVNWNQTKFFSAMKRK